MTDKTEFKKVLHRFKHEANAIMRSDWVDSPIPLKRFLCHIEAEPCIKEYLDQCVVCHTPEGFNAAEEVALVARRIDTTFEPFSDVPEEASAQIYLILKEVVAKGIDGRSFFYYGFSSGKQYCEMYNGFLDKVVRPLILEIEEHLVMIGFDLGLDDGGSSTNYFGHIQNAQFNNASGGSTIQATQNNGIDANTLNRLLDAVIEAAKSEIDDKEVIKDVCEVVENVRAQTEGGELKCGVLKSAFSFLRGVSSSAEFVAAVVQVVEFFNHNGFQISLPG